MNDGPELPAPEDVDFTYYGKVIFIGPERPPRDVDEPRLWTLTFDTARSLSDEKTQAACDGCYIAMPSLTTTPTLQSSRVWTRYRPSLLNIVKTKRRPLPLSDERAIAPIHTTTKDATVLEWASSTSPRADKRGRIRTACSLNSPTSVFEGHDLPRPRSLWTRYANI
jgi:hypothetical protein